MVFHTAKSQGSDKGGTMAVQRKPQLGEKVMVWTTPEQRRRSTGDNYLFRYEGLIGTVQEQGDEYAPTVYLVKVPGIDLPALVGIKNLRTPGGEPFKPNQGE